MVRSGDVGRVLLLSKLGRLAGCVEHPDIEIVLELELSWSGLVEVQYYITKLHLGGRAASAEEM